MAKRKFQIDQLIINSPYEEPSSYWSYDRELRMFERKSGRRRPPRPRRHEIGMVSPDSGKPGRWKKPTRN